MSFLTRVKGMLQIEQLKCVVYEFPSEVVRCIYPGRRDGQDPGNQIEVCNIQGKHPQ